MKNSLFVSPEMEIVDIALEVSMLEISDGDPAENSANEIVWGNP